MGLFKKKRAGKASRKLAREQKRSQRKLDRAYKKRMLKWKRQTGLWTKGQQDAHFAEVRRREKEQKRKRRPEISPRDWRNAEDGWRPPGW